MKQTTYWWMVQNLHGGDEEAPKHTLGQSSISNYKEFE